MIRRFNYTQRKRIEESMVSVEIQDADEDEDPQFIAKVDLSRLDLPPDAPIVIEAKRERSSRRFDWGTAGSPMPPTDCYLTSMPKAPKFRIMALDPDGSRRILALADNIKPSYAGADGTKSLLHLEEKDLDKEVWRVDFGGGNDTPIMQVNKNIPGISAVVREDGAFRALVIPETLRLILTQALIIDEFDPSDGEGDWAHWIGFVRDFYDAEMPVLSLNDEQTKTDMKEWIDGAVSTFSNERFHPSDRYLAAVGR